MLLLGQLLLNLLYLKLFSLVQILISTINGGIRIQVRLTMLHLMLQICLIGSEQVFMRNGQGLSINSVGFMQFLLPNYPHISLTLHNLLLVPHHQKTLLVLVNLLRTIMFSLSFTLNFVLLNHRLRLKFFFALLLELMVYTNFRTLLHNRPSLFLVLVHVYLHLLKLVISTTLVIMSCILMLSALVFLFLY